jgi:hypothetical protein
MLAAAMAFKFYFWCGVAVALLIGSGAQGLLTNHDATAYQLASKELVPATVVSNTEIRWTPPGETRSQDECSVQLDLSGTPLTALFNALSGACDPNTVLVPGAAVQVEMWNGKPTAIYDGALNWPSEDNPGQSAAMSAAAIFFGGLAAALLLGIGAIHLSIWLILRAVRKRQA